MALKTLLKQGELVHSIIIKSSSGTQQELVKRILFLYELENRKIENPNIFNNQQNPQVNEQQFLNNIQESHFASQESF